MFESKVFRIKNEVTDVSTLDFFQNAFDWPTINNTKIPTVKVFNDLEIYISKNLKCNEHTNFLYQVAQISSYQISKSFKTNSATILTKQFKIYVGPKLEYNTQIWSP